MGSFKRPHAYDPLDLEIIDLVYEVAWEQVSARKPSQDTTKDQERKASLRKRVFALAGNGGTISTLCSTESLRAYRSRSGRNRRIEITFSPKLRLEGPWAWNRATLLSKSRMSTSSCVGEKPIRLDLPHRFVSQFEAPN